MLYANDNYIYEGDCQTLCGVMTARNLKGINNMEEHGLHLADENYFESFRVLIDNMAKGHSHIDSNLKFTDCGMAALFFNNVFLFKPFLEVTEKVSQAKRYFSEVGRSFRVVVREEYSGVVDRAANQLCLKKVDSVPLMIHQSISELQAPSDFNFLQVNDDKTLQDYRGVMASAFVFPEWLIEKVLSKGLLKEQHVVMLVGYEKGVACTGAMLIQQGDLAGIYWVGTKQGYERKGLAAKATTQAILIGRERGCTWSVLQASDKGMPVYQRMGFETVAHYHYQVYQPLVAEAE